MSFTRAAAELNVTQTATVSCLPSLAAKWLVPRLASCQNAHPEIEVRIATTIRVVDFRHEEIDLAIRYGKGRWPGLRAAWLMAENVFPVCSPALLAGDRPLRRPDDLFHHTLLHVNLYRDEWFLWLTDAGLPPSLAFRPGLTFDLGLMALQAAIDGLAVALGRTPFVEADIAAGRLVEPFDLVLASEAGFYVVAPEASADTPKVAQFREWLIASAKDK